MVLGMAQSAPATRRVREDFLPTWGIFGGLKVLTMAPYAFPPLRDLVYLPDQGVITKAHWGLIADLANILQARAHIIFGAPIAPAYQALLASWQEKPGIIVLAGDGDVATNTAPQLMPKPAFVFDIPGFMKIPFLPKTGEAKREISKQVWGEP